MPFYVFAWIAAISSGISVVITKLTSRYSIKNSWYFTFLWSLIVCLFTLPLALANHAGFPNDWGPIVAASLFSALFNIAYIYAMYTLDVSTISPLFNFRTVFAVLLGSLFLGEQHALWQWYIALGIIVTGVFASLDEKFNPRSFLRPAVGIGLLAMLFLALNNLFISFAMDTNDVWTTNFWTAFISLLMLIPTVPLFWKDMQKTTVNQVGSVAAIGVFSTITNLTANIAYGSNVGISSLIISIPFSMIFAVILARFRPELLEKHTLKVYIIRFAAAALMIAGALILSR